MWPSIRVLGTVRVFVPEIAVNGRRHVVVETYEFHEFEGRSSHRLVRVQSLPSMYDDVGAPAA
jgi:hypothetical protein